MSWIDIRSPATFFAELLLPLRQSNLRRGISYLDLGQRRHTYWCKVASRTGGMERLSSARCDATVMLGLLGSYWALRSEASLLQLLPHLERLLEDAPNSPPADQAEQISEVLYPLF